MDETFSSLKEKLATKVGKSLENDHNEKPPPNKEASPDTQRYIFSI